MLGHYVFLKYRDGTSDEHVTAFCERMLALGSAIGEIQHLEIGRDELQDARSWDPGADHGVRLGRCATSVSASPSTRGGHGLQPPFVMNVASVNSRAKSREPQPELRDRQHWSGRVKGQARPFDSVRERRITSDASP